MWNASFYFSWTNIEVLLQLLVVPLLRVSAAVCSITQLQPLLMTRGEGIPFYLFYDGRYPECFLVPFLHIPFLFSVLLNVLNMLFALHRNIILVYYISLPRFWWNNEEQILDVESHFKYFLFGKEDRSISENSNMLLSSILVSHLFLHELLYISLKLCKVWILICLLVLL